MKRIEVRKAGKVEKKSKKATSSVKPRRQSVKVKSAEDRLCWKLVGVGLLALAAFAAIALATYQSGNAAGNLVGVWGHTFAFGGYVAFGLAIWCVPVALVIGGLKLFEPIPKEVEEISNGKICLRICGHILMALVLTGIIQLTGRWSWVQQLLGALQIGHDAGGWVGRVFMTNGLEKGVAAFGATFLSFGLLFVSLCMALGLKTVRKLFEIRLPDFCGWLEEAEETVKESAKIKYPVNAELPPLSLLNPVPPKGEVQHNAEAMGQELMKKLKEFNIFATLSYTTVGPTVTQFAIKPGHGVRVDKITSLAKDLQLELEVKSLRVFAPIPGKKAIGVQVSNPSPQTVYFREIIESEPWTKNATWPSSAASPATEGRPKYPVPLLLGQDVDGNSVVADLTKMPHLLVAGASGKGKSVCLNSIICGLLMSRTPEQLRFIFVDPKFVEFSCYAKLPHLLVPVVTEVKKVVGALRWATKEMERRLKEFSTLGARNILEYNETAKEKVPYIVIVIDEVADIMFQCGRDVDSLINRLAALARATGIHLILATQRPDVKTISGTIKANIPGRIALGTTTLVDSRTILDESGAEYLVYKGEMLYKADEGLIRTQGALVVKEEIDRIIDFTVKQWPARIDNSIVEQMESESKDEGQGQDGGNEDGITEEEYERAKAIVIEANRASISMLQQRMKIGYNHASRMIDLLEKRGVIGPHRGAGPREVISG